MAKLSWHRAAIIAGIFGAALLLMLLLRKAHIPGWWDNPSIINFLAAWIPFVISVFIAFVPEHEMSRTQKWLWRSAVIIIGFAWSAVLWHQQVITDALGKKDKIEIVTNAVTQSNAHSDQQIDGVRADVKTTTQALDQKLTNLSSQVSTTEKTITGNLSKFSPPVPQYAKLQFSFFTQSSASLPLTTESLAPDKDGIFTVDFVVTNISETTTAKNGDIWVIACDQCTIVEEPQGFDRPKGLPELERHKTFQNLNPGVTLEKMTVKLRVNGLYQAFLISLRYSCETCGKVTDAQDLKALITPYLGPLTTSP
jgi:hypothetical protein